MEGGIHFRLLSRIVQRLHMPSLLYWGLGTSVYLHSSSSTPTDLWSRSHYYISVACMPIKMLYSCLLVYADLALTATDLCSSDRFRCTCPRTCQEVIPKHARLDGKRGIIPLSRWFSNFYTGKPFMPVFALCPLCHIVKVKHVEQKQFLFLDGGVIVVFSVKGQAGRRLECC